MNLQKQARSGAEPTGPDKLSPAKQLSEIRRKVLEIVDQAEDLWLDQLKPALAKKDIVIAKYEDLTKEYVSYVTFKGYSNNVEEIYKDGSLLVVPSVFENCPMCILEAMVRGIPSICTRVGGIPEIVEEGKNGEFIDIHDPFSSFAAMSAKILSNYDYYSNACVSASKSHTLDFQSKMWKVFFNSI